MRLCVKLSSLARVKCERQVFGPDASIVMNGWLISVDMVPESSILAFSAASRRRCKAILSLLGRCHVLA